MQKVHVYVTNRVATLTSDFDAGLLLPYWSYSIPNYKWIIQAKPFLRNCISCGKTQSKHQEITDHQYEPRWSGRETFLRGEELPAGLFWATRKEIEQQLGIKFIVKGELERAELKTTNTLTSDRDYQNECVKAMLKALRFGGGLVLGATASGKTRTAAMFFSQISGACLFVVDQLLLMEQAIEELQEALQEPIGRVGDSDFEPQRITVATRQSVALHQQETRYKKWTNTLQVMLIDEIHSQLNHSNFKAVERIEPLAVYGLTATLSLKIKQVRLKAHSLCGPVLFEYPLLKGQEQGYLAQGIAVRIFFHNPVSPEEQKLFGWAKLYTQKIVEDPKRNYCIVRLVREAHAQGKYVILLVTRVRHLKILSDKLSHIPHRVISGTFNGQNVKVEDRIEAKSQFEAGDIRLLIANTVFKKGVNLKRVDLIIDAASGRSENDAVQKFGRGIRKHQDKTGLLYFDINDWEEGNPKNWFHVGSRYRTRALQRAGVKTFKYDLKYEDFNAKILLAKAERWLDSSLNSSLKNSLNSSEKPNKRL